MIKSIVLTIFALAVAQAQTETVVHSFDAYPGGLESEAGLILDAAGNLYGTTFAGGPREAGVVFKIDISGVLTVLHGFASDAEGGFPAAGLALDASGNLYGTTTEGGEIDGWGIVFKLSSSGELTVIHRFKNSDGATPVGGVTLGPGGEIYGTTSTGGRDNAGVVFKIDTSGAETVLYSFTGNADGSNPLAGVILDSEGNLYGTTSAGGSASGSAGYGVVFKVDTSGKETVLHTFTNGADGAFPRADLIADAAGNLYGTTVKGGRGNSHRVDEGTVFKVTPSGQETVIYNFAKVGSAPFGGVVLDSAGNLYGTTDAGGIKGGGIVFKLNAAGQETVLHEFTSAEPNAPSAGVVLDSAGNLYGTTSTGSSPLTEGGGVFAISAAGQESVLHVFSDGKGGATPQGGVVADTAGNLYGATSEGGLWGAGAVFKLTPAGIETPLYNFTGGADGAIAGGVVLDSAGNLYGSTFEGGASNLGAVYRLTPGGAETVLHSFTGGSDGMHPSGVILDPQGNVYGSTEGGTIFEIDPAGNEAILHTFTDDNESGISGLIRDAAGNLYGTTAGVVDNFNGTVFKLDPLGNLTILHSFTGGADGANPVGGVVEDAQGNYYGTTTYGGALGCGNVFKLDPSGVVTALYDFPSYSSPSGVILDSSGDLFGTIATGGAYRGAVYEVTAGGQEIVLYNFLDGKDGGQPSGPLLLNAAGDLYGTGISGGKGGAGVVFEIQP